MARKSSKKDLMTLNDLEKLMQAQAVEESERLGSGATSDTLKINGKIFTLQEATLGDEISVVVVAHTNEKRYF